MISAAQQHLTRCPRCSAPFVYQLGVNKAAGGGLRYDVSCPPCGEIYFQMCAPLVQLPVAA